MAAPWERYQEQGPWTKYSAPAGAAQFTEDQIREAMPLRPGAAVERKGFAAQVNDALTGKTPTPTQQTQAWTQTSNELGKNSADILKGGIESAGTLGLGFAGDAANTFGSGYNLASTGVNALSGVDLGKVGPSFLPTTESLTNQLSSAIGGSGASPNKFERIGRFLGAPIGIKAGSNLAGPVLGVVRNTIGKSIAGSGPTSAAQEAHDAGYVLPPTMASEKPGPVSNLLSAASGKIKIGQAASAKNQNITNQLIARSVGLAEDQPITEAALEAVRDNAGQSYEAVRNAPIQIMPDQKWASEIKSINNVSPSAKATLPSIMGNPDLENMLGDLGKMQALSPNDAVDAIRALRFQAQQNLKNFAAPKTMDLGRAQSQAAHALEGLLERNLVAATTARAPIGAQGGDMTQLVSQLQDARKLIAKTYTVEKALNPATGNIDASVLGRLLKGGTPLEGDQASVAKAALAFPKATQNVAKVGGHEKFSVLDMMAALGTHGKTLGLSLARPAARAITLSAPYQKALTSGPLPYPNLAVDPFTAGLLAVPNAVGKPNALYGPNYSAR